MLLTISAIVLVTWIVINFMVNKIICRHFTRVLGIVPVSGVLNEHFASEKLEI